MFSIFGKNIIHPHFSEKDVYRINTFTHFFEQLKRICFNYFFQYYVVCFPAPPDTSQYQYEETSGFYYDPSTQLYYDANSQVSLACYTMITHELLFLKIIL